MTPHRLTIHQAHQLLKDKKLSSVELIRDCLKRVKEVEPKVKAFVTVTEELALKQAEEADKRIAKGDIKPLTGVPVVIKDVLCTKGIKTTCSSKMLARPTWTSSPWAPQPSTPPSSPPTTPGT
jgi:aspartyl-tRNA(Asn)/glutamyl-tRNA(Gln) amidotransferase subunit A